MALSTCEAECVAMCASVQESIFLRSLYHDFTGLDQECVKIHADNQGAIKLASNPVFHKRTKHIDVRYHFIREKVEQGVVKFIYVPSERNEADVMTKPVSRQKLRDLLKLY